MERQQEMDTGLGIEIIEFKFDSEPQTFTYEVQIKRIEENLPLIYDDQLELHQLRPFRNIKGLRMALARYILRPIRQYSSLSNIEYETVKKLLNDQLQEEYECVLTDALTTA